jgi:hypothetical protein
METYNISGWVDLPDEVNAMEERFGVFSSVAPLLVGIGKGKIVCLHNSYTKIGISFLLRNQGNIGSCVGFGVAGAVDTLKAVEIANGDRETFKNYTSEEMIYGGGRKFGGYRISGDGCVVAHAISYINEFGTLAKGKYGNIDVTTYSVDRCRRWSNASGFPKTLESIAKDTVVRQFARVKSWEEFRDSVASGHPVVTGSSLGFSSSTDDEGFCKQNTTWQHSMFGLAVDDESKRPGGLISNSWGNYLKITKRKLDQPDGCFWADADVIDRMMKNGDCWAISDFQGFKKPVNTNISW